VQVKPPSPLPLNSGLLRPQLNSGLLRPVVARLQEA
jgi:hypothetical protein